MLGMGDDFAGQILFSERHEGVKFYKISTKKLGVDLPELKNIQFSKRNFEIANVI